MQELSDIALNLAAAALAFLFGLLWQQIRKALANYQARRFWRPIMSKDLQLVVGRFRGLQGFEASGVIGAGDALAMISLREYFNKIGFDGFEVSLNDQLGFGDPTGNSLKTNLILLGGPDANTLTYDIVRRLNLGIAFKEIDPRYPDELLDPRIFDMSLMDGQGRVRRTLHALGLRSGPVWRTPVIADIAGSGHVYKPKKSDDDTILADCGVIVRAPNPFDPNKNVIILCGSYGYGTWAAVQLSQSKDFIRRVPKGAGQIECVFKVDVVRDTPQQPELHFVREAHAPAPSDDATP